MFVQYLSERQQAALLHYSYEMMRADNIVEAEERAYLETLRSQSRPGVEAADVPISELASLFEDRLSRIVLLLELVGMGYADEKFSPHESNLIGEIAAALDIGERDLENVRSWVQRQLLLVEEAHELMAGNR